MRIRIRLPQALERGWDIWSEWINEPIWRSPEGRLTFRRIDVLLLFFGIACVSWYGYTGGWQGAVMGGAMYLLVLLCALWIF